MTFSARLCNYFSAEMPQKIQPIFRSYCSRVWTLVWALFHMKCPNSQCKQSPMEEKKNPQKIGLPLPLHKRALKGATPSILLCYPEAHHSQQIDHGVPLNKVKGPYPCWSLPESLTVTSMGGTTLFCWSSICPWFHSSNLFMNLRNHDTETANYIIKEIASSPSFPIFYFSSHHE